MCQFQTPPNVFIFYLYSQIVSCAEEVIEFFAQIFDIFPSSSKNAEMDVRVPVFFLGTTTSSFGGGLTMEMET